MEGKEGWGGGGSKEPCTGISAVAKKKKKGLTFGGEGLALRRDTEQGLGLEGLSPKKRTIPCVGRGEGNGGSQPFQF